MGVTCGCSSCVMCRGGVTGDEFRRGAAAVPLIESGRGAVVLIWTLKNSDEAALNSGHVTMRGRTLFAKQAPPSTLFCCTARAPHADAREHES